MLDDAAKTRGKTSASETCQACFRRNAVENRVTANDQRLPGELVLVGNAAAGLPASPCRAKIKLGYRSESDAYSRSTELCG